MRKRLSGLWLHLIGLDNLYYAYRKARRGKQSVGWGEVRTGVVKIIRFQPVLLGVCRTYPGTAGILPASGAVGFQPTGGRMPPAPDAA